MAGIMGLFASELDEFVADYDNQFWDASFHGETYPPRIIMERSTPPLYRVEDDGTKTLEPNPSNSHNPSTRRGRQREARTGLSGLP